MPVDFAIGVAFSNDYLLLCSALAGRRAPWKKFAITRMPISIELGFKVTWMRPKKDLLRARKPLNLHFMGTELRAVKQRVFC